MFTQTNNIIFPVTSAITTSGQRHLEESHEFDLHHSRETVEANQDISGDFKVLENMPEKQSSMKFRGLAVSFVLSGLESIKDVKKGRNKGS